LFDATVLNVEKMNRQNLEYMVELDIPELGRIKVTTVDDVKTGQKVSFTIRPEKIVINTDKPTTNREDINLFNGMVDEPIYSGFQTKFYVKTTQDKTLKVIKQHANYSDDGPAIRWKDTVYLSWSADDGYIVEVKS